MGQLTTARSRSVRRGFSLNGKPKRLTSSIVEAARLKRPYNNTNNAPISISNPVRMMPRQTF
jgi:hypothetical protein